MLSLFLSALLHRPNANRLKQFKPPMLPDLTQSEVVTIDPKHYLKYCELTQWTYSTLHPCYLQVLSLPMQLACLSHPRSPFPVLGLVHRKNVIRMKAAMSLGDAVTLNVGFKRVIAHKLGWDVIMYTQAIQNGQCCYEAEATYLVRIRAPHVDRQPTKSNQESIRNEKDGALSHSKPVVTITANADIGRKYAKVSGDGNPIHLYGITAKLFGFPRAIAHGMWSLATSVSYVYKPQTNEHVTISCRFKTPFFLPGEALLRRDEQAHLTGFNLVSSTDKTPYLEGKISIEPKR